MSIDQFLGGNVKLHQLPPSVLEERVTDSHLHFVRPSGAGQVKKTEYVEINDCRYIYYEEDGTLYKGSGYVEVMRTGQLMLGSVS